MPSPRVRATSPAAAEVILDRHRDLERSERELGVEVADDLNDVAFDTDLTDLGDRSDAALEIDDDLDIEP